MRAQAQGEGRERAKEKAKKEGHTKGFFLGVWSEPFALKIINEMSTNNLFIGFFFLHSMLGYPTTGISNVNLPMKIDQLRRSFDYYWWINQKRTPEKPNVENIPRLPPI